MTTPVRYEPIGPVLSGDDVVLAIKVNSTLYVATYDSTATQGENLIIENVLFYPLYIGSPAKINPILTTSTLLILTVTGIPESMVMTVKTPSIISGYTLNVAQLQRGTVNDPQFRLTLVNVPETKIKLTSKYSNPPNGSSLFSTVDYRFFSMGGNVNAYALYRPPSNPTSQAVNTSIFTISAAYHTSSNADMTVKTCSSGVEDPLGALQIFYCSSCRDYTTGCGSLCTNKPVKAWTRSNDCQRAIDYNYCLTNETCGSCLGACQDTTSDCLYNPPNSQNAKNGDTRPFRCSKALGNLTPGKNIPWYQQMWFIAFIVILIVIAIIIAAWHVLGNRKEKPINSQNTQVIETPNEMVRKNTLVSQTST